MAAACGHRPNLIGILCHLLRDVAINAMASDPITVQETAGCLGLVSKLYMLRAGLCPATRSAITNLFCSSDSLHKLQGKTAGWGKNPAPRNRSSRVCTGQNRPLACPLLHPESPLRGAASALDTLSIVLQEPQRPRSVLQMFFGFGVGRLRYGRYRHAEVANV